MTSRSGPGAKQLTRRNISADMDAGVVGWISAAQSTIFDAAPKMVDCAALIHPTVLVRLFLIASFSVGVLCRDILHPLGRQTR